MRKSVKIIFSVISLLFASVLIAQVPRGDGRPGGPPGGPGGRGGATSPLFTAMDTNHDRKLSAEEIAAAPKTLLKADVNGDGTITLDELQPPPEATVASPDDLSQQLMAFDKNHDGVLTRDELPERLQPLFERADTNHDGKVAPDELRALAARQTLPVGSQKMQSRDPIFMALDTDHDGILSAAEIAAAGASLLTLDKNHDGEISADEMRPPQATPLEQANHAVEENDTNKDGKLSRAEAPDWLREQFDVLDKNHDGFLDRDELAAFFVSQGGRRGGSGAPGKSDDRGPAGPPRPDLH